ncbi:MAG TPA: YceI family protein [Gemmatimonadales bacterium]|nr:YceI family protein [Gemmatimonadales bacterium]
MHPGKIVRSTSVIAAAVVCAFAPRARSGGTRLTVDSKASLAWWQINPHLNQLWATTCPSDPGWLPGEGRSSGTGWNVDATAIKLPPKDALSDTSDIPLFPRKRVRAVCEEAVHGELVAPDTVTWKGVHGKIVVDAADLITGEKFRDNFAREHVLETDRYPQMTFVIDSLQDLRKSGDSLRAMASGSVTIHGTTVPLSVPVLAWPDAGGLRVRGRWHMTADELWTRYGISKIALGLGVGMGIWRQLWMGVDVVLHAEPLAP